VGGSVSSFQLDTAKDESNKKNGVKSTWEKNNFRFSSWALPAFNNAFRGATPVTEPSNRQEGTGTPRHNPGQGLIVKFYRDVRVSVESPPTYGRRELILAHDYRAGQFTALSRGGPQQP